MKRALISVSDKTGIVDFAGELVNLGYQIISTGGTASVLSEHGISVTKVSTITDFPEIMNGRVKTLHPRIHGALLGARDDESHQKEAMELGIEWIDIVVVNLYPFQKTIKKPDATEQEIIENIDIGGPTMIRAAAKNYKYVTIITDNADFDIVLKELQENGNTASSTRLRLAQKAFVHTADYDTAIANHFSRTTKSSFLQISCPEKEVLRYGENPHQKAAYYEYKDLDLLEQLHGKQLSFNNYLDIDAALKIIMRFEEPTVAIIKHTNPCGIASGNNLTEAYKKAFATDPLSPFGGIVIINQTLDMVTAQEINKIFTEIIIAPEFEQEVVKFLQKKKNRRLIKYLPAKLEKLHALKNVRSCLGGFLAQEADLVNDNPAGWQIVTNRKPTESEMRSLLFGWKTVATLKSNAVCFTAEDRTLALGIGQTSRIDSTEIAVSKANKFGLNLKGSICASDAFFPFRDSIDSIAELGIKAVIQPGGSTGDEEVIAACNEHNIAMIFTGKRHFRH